MSIYSITGMTCGNCRAKVQAALDIYIGAEVTLAPPQLTIPDAIDPGIDALNKTLRPLSKYLVIPAKAGIHDHGNDAIKEWLITYHPLFLIVGLISLVSLRGAGGWHDWMIHFMAGFFIVFSFFKLLNLKGFAEAYAGYDLLAKKSRAYALAYPFIELALGMAYLFRFEMQLTLIATIIVMGFSSIGVIQAVRRKQQIRCACLGTVLNLPMSTITIVEDLGMVAMAALMLFSA
jgi:hypothetical protein